MAHAATTAIGREAIRPSRRSGHPSFTRVSCNMTTKNAPASGIVAGGSAAWRSVDGQGEPRNRSPRPLPARTRGAARSLRSCGDWRRVHHELSGDREFADAPAGCVEDGIGDRACTADLANLTDAFDPERIDAAVFDFDELDRDLGSVGVDGD